MVGVHLGQVDGVRHVLALRVDADLAFGRIDADIALGDHLADVIPLGRTSARSTICL